MSVPGDGWPLRDLLPYDAGIGARSAHYRELLTGRHEKVRWIEVHSENFFGHGGWPLAVLEQLRSLYPLSLHGVGLSIAGTDPLVQGYLQRLRGLIERFDPVMVSDHLCWSAYGGVHFNALLPFPYTDETLNHVAQRVNQVQSMLGRPILLENIASYLKFADNGWDEAEFLNAVCDRCGCGILLDVSNLCLNAWNHSFDPLAYIDALDPSRVAEYHLGGMRQKSSEPNLFIDTHDQPICNEAWLLYQQALSRIGPRPTIIEWDEDLPTLTVLIAQADKADTFLNLYHEHAA